MIINKIVASSWYLSSFSYMVHGHTYIRFTYGHLMGPEQITWPKPQQAIW